MYVGSVEEVIKFIQVATSNRSLGHTNMNEASSRSHMVLFLTVYQNNLQDLSAKSAKLTIIDLAGSEKVGKTGAEGKILE
jgi:kinesin family protein 5